MIDTVKVTLDGFDLPVGLDDEKWIRRVKDIENHVKGKSYREESLHLKAEMLDNALKHVRVSYSVNRRSLSVEFSMARVVGMGEHNIEGPDHRTLPHVIDIVDMLIAWGFTNYWREKLTGRVVTRRLVNGEIVEEGYDTPEIPSIREWTVGRIDAFVNFKPKSAPFDVAKRVLTDLKPIGGRDVRKLNETLYVQNRGKRKTRVIAIYDKEHEVESKERSRPYAYLSKGSIRVEVRLTTRRQIAQECGLGKNKPLLRDVVQPQALERVMRRNLALLHVREGLTSVDTIFEALSERLGAKAAGRLSEFMRLSNVGGADGAAKQMEISTCTKRRWVRELLKAGLFPAAVQAVGVIEEVIVQALAAVETMRPAPVRSEAYIVQSMSASEPPRDRPECA